MAWKRLAIVAALTGSVVASGDTVYLKDGSRVDGTVRRADGGKWLVTTGAKTVTVADEQVDRIDVSPAGPAAVSVALASLRRSSENVDTPQEAVTRYQRFIEQNRDPASADEARKDLATWQDRVARGMTRVAAKWVTPEEKTALFGHANQIADRARQLLKQGRTIEATPLLAESLAIDPANPTALYLSGLLAFGQDKLPAARKDFEAVNAIVPNHAPTLNNLAIVRFRQKQYVAAMVSFDAAMQASPVNKAVLDDVATAMQQWPANVRKSEVVLKAERRFADQDVQLAQRLATVGLHRVGATWVDTVDIQTARQRDQLALAQLDQLSADFDQSTGRIKAIDQSSADTQDQMHRIEAQSVIVDPRTGGLIQLPYPATYATLTADLARMRRDRGVEVAKLDTIARQAAVIQNARMEQQGIGIFRPIGPEGTPFKMPVAAPVPLAPPPIPVGIPPVPASTQPA